MADDVTTGELARRLLDLHNSIERLAARVVTREVFQVEQQRITEWLVRLEREHADLEASVRVERDRNIERRQARTEAEQQQRITDRRLVWSAVLAGAVSLVVTLASKLYGGA